MKFMNDEDSHYYYCERGTMVTTSACDPCLPAGQHQASACVEKQGGQKEGRKKKEKEKPVSKATLYAGL